ncbi:hypothetical protein D3C76_1168900 [compost metagenome]
MDQQVITPTFFAADQNHRHQRRLGHARQHKGTAGGGSLIDGEQWSEHATAWAVVLIRGEPYGLAALEGMNHAAQIFAIEHRLVGTHATFGLRPFHRFIVVWAVHRHHWLTQAHGTATQLQRHKVHANHQHTALVLLRHFQVVDAGNVEPTFDALI